MQENKCWSYRKTDKVKASELSATTGIPVFLAGILLSRGYSTPDSIRTFLEPNLEALHDPFLMKDMDKAADIVAKALIEKRKIIIYGDYDADGITAVSILLNYFNGVAPDVITDYYIPDRIADGYGLNADAAERIASSDADIIITVDCGITSFDEASVICNAGKKLVITDHHECREEIPVAEAVINPHRKDCLYPYKYLSGAGVAFKLVQAIQSLQLANGLQDNFCIDNLLPLAAIGTIADIMPLTGENRIIAKCGLNILNSSYDQAESDMACVSYKTGLPGIWALADKAGIKAGKIGSWETAFILSPRINAAGRIGDASRAVKLFTGCVHEEALRIAAIFDTENKQRQEIEKETVRQAIEAVENRNTGEKCGQSAIVEYCEKWHPGVIGIAASRIAEMYNKPCILLTSVNGSSGSANESSNVTGELIGSHAGVKAGNLAKGSGRSIQGFNLIEAIGRCSGCLAGYGGHEQAAGISMEVSKIDSFREEFNNYVSSVFADKKPAPVSRTDGIIEPDDMNFENALLLERLEPFGEGNPDPLFLGMGMTVRNIRQLSDGRHLKMTLNTGASSQNGAIIEAIGFNMGDKCRSLAVSDVVDAVFGLEVNRWNGTERVQLKLKDIRKRQQG